jgi:predicted RNA binding protein YcfA (HicA-like mRNA interferase family)
MELFRAPPRILRARLLTVDGARAILMKIRALLLRLENDGWVLVRYRGSHRQYKHPVKTGHVTVPGHPGDDVRIGTLRSVLKQAGLL